MKLLLFQSFFKKLYGKLSFFLIKRAASGTSPAFEGLLYAKKDTAGFPGRRQQKRKPPDKRGPA